jgi:hypothetical protein
MMDHFTLRSNNAEVNQNLTEYRVAHFKKVTNLMLYLLVGNAFVQLGIYISSRGQGETASQLKLVLNFVFVLLPILLRTMLNGRRINLMFYSVYAMFFVFSALMTANHKDWAKKNYPVYYDNCIWGAYTFCMFAPCQNWYQAWILLTPTLILCSVVSSYDQVMLNREYVNYLPEDLADNIETGFRGLKANLFCLILISTSFAYVLH